MSLRRGVFFLVGLPASGKSTQAAKIVRAKDALLLSSDAIREELYGDASIQADNQRIFSVTQERAVNTLSKGISVVYDATNITSKFRRQALRRLSKHADFCTAVVMATPYEECLRRNKERERQVPEYVIQRQLHQFEMPQSNEGFDHIFIVRPDDFKPDVERLAKLMDIPHDNPHHTQTVLKHGQKCQWLVEMCSDDPILSMAALYHDCGKPMTKVFHDAKGNPTKEAHYYGHHNVGAYLALTHLAPDMKDYEYVRMIGLINYHMHPYSWKGDDTREKYRKLWGKWFYENIVLLHECDVGAH